MLSTFRLFQRAGISIAFISLVQDLNPGPENAAHLVKKTKGLSIGHLNIRSLRDKVDQLSLNNSFQHTVPTLSETWLSNFILDAKVQLPGFSIVRMDRSGIKSGGGVIAYVCYGLPYRVCYDLSVNEAECIWMEVCYPKSMSDVFIGFRT